MSFRVSAQAVSPIGRAHAEKWVRNTCGANLTEIAPQVFHWLSAQAPTLEVRDAARSDGIDLNAIPAAWRWSDVGLVASDMDSTLINVECIDEIAAFAGLKSQVAEITERAMQGELDFPSALRARVALLAGLPETVLEQVYRERVQLTGGAAALIAQAQAVGAETLLVSGGFTFFTERIKSELGLTQTVANTLMIENGRLSGAVAGAIIDGEAKAAAVFRQKKSLPAGKLVICLGDGANDIPMMAFADLSVAYHAKPKLRSVTNVAVDHRNLDAVRRLFPE